MGGRGWQLKNETRRHAWSVFQKKTSWTVIAHMSLVRESTSAANACAITGRATSFRPVFSTKSMRKLMIVPWTIF